MNSWLTGILRHKILDHFRAADRKRAEAAAPLDSEEAGDPLDEWFTSYGAWKLDPNAGLEVLETDPRQLAERAEIMVALRTCLDRLPSNLRRIFVLREMDDCETGEICQNLGITPGSLAVMLHRSRQLLRVCLQRTWLNS